MSALYGHGKEEILGGALDWSDPVYAILIDVGAYTVNLVGDIFVADVPGPARISVSPNLTGRTWFAGAADADDVVFPTVTGPTCEALVLAWNTGSPATDKLIAYVDEALGLPVIPNGHDESVFWDNGPRRIFRI